jgi:hypothetical protein
MTHDSINVPHVYLIDVIVRLCVLRRSYPYSDICLIQTRSNLPGLLLGLVYPNHYSDVRLNLYTV